ncbi:MAG TPA: ribosome biogenesis GTPase Der [Planctomycetota bacterium]|nr:ribosome biogenesis GTPase Der [Planctomycetota bacterium]
MRHPNPRKRGRLKPSSAPAAGAGVQVPFIAIVGRPNVGKSTLFNRLMGKRISIVEKTAGTTRDRVSAILVLPSGRRVELCDMGGLGGTEDPLDKDVDRQIKAAMEHASAILFVVDARDGATPLDRTIAQRVLRLGKPVVLVANKAETTVLETLAGEFYALGAGEPLAISAREGTGRQDLLERLDGLFKDEDEEEEDPGPRELRIAIVGRRNAGKSSFVNSLFGSERVIVSEMPGTTRDAVDVRCIVDGEPIVLIDTAGLRKRGKADDQIELISHGRALEAIRRCDVAIVLLDAIRDVSEVDKKICELVLSENKGLLVVANKWDLVGDQMTPEQFADYVRKKIPSISFAPVVAISCKTGFNIDVPVAVVRELHRQSLTRIGTGELNRVVHEAFMRRKPRRKRHVEAKLYFATQIKTNPVTLVFFVNKPALFDADYQRFLASELRALLPWSEIPLKLILRERKGLLERGLSKAAREKRALERTRRALLEDENAMSEDALAELDAPEVQAALREELAVEEKSERSASFGDVAEDDAPGEALDAEEEEEEEKPRDAVPADELLYGEDAPVVRRRLQRERRRRRHRRG